MRDSRFDSAQIMICDIVDAYAVPDWMCNINFCNKVRKGDGFNPISIKKIPKTDFLKKVYLLSQKVKGLK